MTRNRLLLLTLFLLIPLSVFLLRNERSSEENSESARTQQQNKVDVQNLEINGRKVLGLTPGNEKEEIKKINVINTPSDDWKPNLEKTLLAQGGNSVKDLTISKVDSFVWSQDGVSLFVESVIVKLKKENNEPISFRVLVDSESGKILQNWDQPVIDPISHTHDFKLKVDPSYEAE